MFCQNWMPLYTLLYLWTRVIAREFTLDSILHENRGSRSVGDCLVETNTGQKPFDISSIRGNAGVCEDSSSICDPAGILNRTEANQLNNMIWDLRREVPCFSYQPCRTNGYGNGISITLVSRVIVPEGSSATKELNRCAKRLAIGRGPSDICENCLLIVFSQFNTQMSIYEKSQAGSTSLLSTFCINKTHQDSQRYFNAAKYLEGLLYVITSLKNDFLGFGCRPNDGETFKWINNNLKEASENYSYKPTAHSPISSSRPSNLDNNPPINTTKHSDKPKSSAQKHSIHTGRESGHTTIYSGSGSPEKDRETTVQLAWWVIVLIVLGLCVVMTVAITGLLCCCGCEKYMASGGPELSSRQRAWTV